MGPRFEAQLEQDVAENEALFVTFAMGIICRDMIAKQHLLEMMRAACDHGELARYNRIMAIKDDALRGSMTMMLLGEMLVRCTYDTLHRNYGGEEK